jgi:hypothetical protein
VLVGHGRLLAFLGSRIAARGPRLVNARRRQRVSPFAAAFQDTCASAKSRPAVACATGGRNVSDDDEDCSRRFDLELWIVHPTMHPNEISRALNLVAQITHTVGEPRMTPNGKRLPGVYPDTRWRHTKRCTVEDQWFADELARFVENLKSRSEALAKIQATGGITSVIIQFLGDGYFGDEIGLDTLSTMVELGLRLDIECFVVPQNS